MRVINLSLPDNWLALDDAQLRYVFQLLASEHSETEVKTLFLMKYGNLRVVRKEGNVFVCKLRSGKGGGVFLLSSLQVTECLSHLNWLDGIPAYPVRISSIGKHRAVAPDLQGVPFAVFLYLDNLFQGYLHTQKPDMLLQMAELLYETPDIKLTEAERTGIFYWFASVKQLFARTFPHFFQPAEVENEMGSPNIGRQLQDSMNAQIRALTGGDITKEKAVLDMDCWRALTELNAKARDYEEMKKSSKSIS